MNRISSTPASVSETMKLVLLALIPGTLVFIHQNGWGAVINIVLAIFSALVFEATALALRKRSVIATLSDYSAAVTALLIALCLPPLIPWWITVLATGFAILLAKHAFGGVGNNLFNPAMVGYAIILISFPAELSLWLQQPAMSSVSLAESINAVFNGGLTVIPNWDALTGATALDQHRTLVLQNSPLADIKLQTSGYFGAIQSEWINLAYLTGGLWMLYKRVINWHIPLSFLGALLLTMLLHKSFSATPLSIQVNLFGGATMLCAFFISTDPVSAATSVRGRIVYGALTGFLVYLIRAYGSYPDSIAFAVLLANCTVPAIDRMDIWLGRADDQANEK